MADRDGYKISFWWSPDVDAYVSGETDARKIRCALCQKAPCVCPEFGAAEYFALIKRRHGLG
ncbi:MAG: hypothetical protein ACRDPT_03185 [Streptomycetales bacterium]